MQKQEIGHSSLEKCLPTQVNGICLIPLVNFVKLLSKKWMLFILMVLPQDSTPLRYSELKERLNRINSERISDTTLSQRLDDLVSHLILERQQFSEIPPRVEYQLSERGIALRESLSPLLEWAIQICHEKI